MNAMDPEQAGPGVYGDVAAVRDPSPVDVVVMIGNSDDKLTQAQWSRFARHAFRVVGAHATAVHGQWGSASLSPWQNAGMFVTMVAPDLDTLRAALRDLAAHFDQDSIALLAGTTEFITP